MFVNFDVLILDGISLKWNDKVLQYKTTDDRTTSTKYIDDKQISYIVEYSCFTLYMYNYIPNKGWT